MTNFKFWKLEGKKVALSISVVLICIQCVQFLTSANIYYSISDIKTADFINTNFPNESVAVYKALRLSVLLNQKHKYQVVDASVIPASAMNIAFTDPKPLSGAQLPDVVVFRSDQHPSAQESQIIKKSYQRVFEDNANNDYVIYALRK